MRWSRQRLVRMAYLMGAGFTIGEIARDPLVAAQYEHSVRVTASRFGVAMRSRDFTISVDRVARRDLDAAARMRGMTASALAGALLELVVKMIWSRWCWMMAAARSHAKGR